jgi:hypothetical protein
MNSPKTQWIWATLLIALGLLTSPLRAQERPAIGSWEALINHRVSVYPFSPDNLFRLGAYTEMKGHYDPQAQSLELAFGGLGTLTFFPDNCLLKTYGGLVLHLDREAGPGPATSRMDAAIGDLLDRVPLLGVEEADPEQLEFVVSHLARKNLEPFDKLYLRHIFLKHGRFDREKQQVVFLSDWLENETSQTIRQHHTSLKMLLAKHILRGYYLDVGGTVYLEDVQREVRFATGEDYASNVAAFKLFVQKLFLQSVQYVAKEGVAKAANSSPQTLYSNAVSDLPEAPKVMQPSGSAPKLKRSVEPLYHPYSWIPMMLGMLRARGISISDPEVLTFFVNLDSFQRIYEQLTEAEKAAVDAYRAAQP